MRVLHRVICGSKATRSAARRKLLAAVVASVPVLANQSGATAQTTYTWNAASASLWGTAANWTPATAPGSNSNTANTDVGQFDSVGTTTTIQFNFGTIGQPYYIGAIRFNAGNTVARTAGSNAGTAGTLVLNGTGANNLILDNLSNVAMSLAPTVSSGTGAMTVRLTKTNSTINAVGAINVTANMVPATGVTAGLTKTGAGVLTLGGTNTFTGDISVEGGGLGITNSSGFGTGNVIYGPNAAGTAGFATTGTVINAIVPLLNNSTANNTTVANNITLPSPVAATSYSFSKTQSTVGNRLDLTGNITGGNSNLKLFFTTTTAGDTTTIFRLAGNNTFTGTIETWRGAIVVASPTAFGNSTNPIRLDANNNLTSGDIRFEVGGTFANPITTIANSSVNPQANAVVLSGDLAGTAGLTVIGSGGGGTGSVTLTGASNTISGNVTVQAGGTLNVGNGGTSGSLGTANIAVAGTLNLNRSDTALAVPGIISGAGVINQTGTGTTTLGGVSTFTGTVNVTNGTLALGSGASIAASNIVVNGGVFDVSALAGYNLPATSTLVVGRSGTPATDVAGNITIGDGVAGNLNVGGTNSARTATFANDVSINSATLRYDLSNATTAGSGVNDLIAVTGNVTLAGTNQVLVNQTAGPLASGSYTLMTYGGTLTGSATNLALAGIGSGTTRQTFTFDVGTGTNSAVTLNVGGTAANLTWVGNASGNVWDVVTTANWTGAPGPTPDNRFFNFDNVTFDATGVGGATQVSIPADVNPGSVTVTGNQSYIFSGAGKIIGTGALNKSGFGNLTLLIDTTHTGGTNITGGVLQIGNGGTTGSVAGNIFNNGTLIYNRSDAITLSNTISGGGSLILLGTGTTTLAGTNTYVGPTTVAGPTLVIAADSNLGTAPAVPTANMLNLDSGTFAPSTSITLSPNRGMSVGPTSGSGGGTVNTGAALTVTLNNNITNAGTGTGSLTKAGTGTLVLGGNNTFSGGVNFNAGAINFTSGSAFGTGTITVAEGVANAVGTTTNPTTFTQFLNNTTTTDTTIPNSIVLPAPTASTVYALSKTSGSGRLNLTGNISGGNANFKLFLNSTVSGDITTTFRLAGNNTFNGTLEIWRGCLIVASPTALGDPTMLLRMNSNTNATLGDLRFEVGGSFPNPINMVVHSPINPNGNAVVLTGAFSGAGNLTIIGSAGGGTGSVAFAGTNTHTGTVAIQAGGTLKVGNGGTVGSLGTGTVTATGTLVFDRSDSFTVSTVIAGPTTGNVLKNGAGTLTYSAANTFTGMTTVTQGVLTLSGSAIGTMLGSITLLPGTTLNPGAASMTLSNNRSIQGSGTIASEVVINSSTIAPGVNGAGTINIGGKLTMAATTVLNFDFGGPPATPAASDSIALSGTTPALVLDGTLNIASSAGMTEGTYLLISNATGGITDNGLTLGTVPAFFNGTITNDGTNVFLNVALVPEPTTVGVIGIAGIGLLGRRRRRRA